MLRVIIESPYGSKDEATVRRNVEYLERCLMDSLKRGETPFASHALYPLVLKDSDPMERKLGMEAGFAWHEVAELIAVYADYGVTKGMQEGINNGLLGHGIRMELRGIGKNSEPEHEKPCNCLYCLNRKTKWDKILKGSGGGGIKGEGKR